MFWLVLWTAVLIIGALGVVASANSLRFGRRVAGEVRQMWARSAEPLRIDRRRLEELPAPARRYLAKAVGGKLAVQTVRLRHGGTFRTKLDGAWLPIHGEHYFAADPPGFVWWGRVRIAPGLWVDARDRSVGGAGNMYVSVESSFTLADSAGLEMDQGALLRLLGEMPWFPTAFLDDRYVTWTQLDGGRARATLRVNGREVAGVFEFGDDGLPASSFADRYRDLGGGKAVLTPWSGEYGGYREIDGLLVPHQINASWHVDGQRIPTSGSWWSDWSTTRQRRSEREHTSGSQPASLLLVGGAPAQLPRLPPPRAHDHPMLPRTISGWLSRHDLRALCRRRPRSREWA